MTEENQPVTYRHKIEYDPLSIVPVSAFGADITVLNSDVQITFLAVDLKEIIGAARQKREEGEELHLKARPVAKIMMSVDRFIDFAKKLDEVRPAAQRIFDDYDRAFKARRASSGEPKK